MSRLNPKESFDLLKDRITSAIGDYFPHEGKKHKLELGKVWVDDNLDINDYRSQKKAKMSKSAWSVPIYAEMSLIDKETNKVKDRQVVRVSDIPKITPRYSYILDGNEYQQGVQFRLKPGIYTREKGDGSVEAHMNFGMGFGGARTSLDLNQKSRKVTMTVGKKLKTPVYSMLKTLGVKDEEIKKSWGEEIFKANKVEDPSSDIMKLYKVAIPPKNQKKNISIKEAAETVKNHLLKNTELDKETTLDTIGVSKDRLDGEALLKSVEKVLNVSRGKAKPDDRSNLSFKHSWGIEDALPNKLLHWRNKQKITSKINNRIDHKDSIKEIISKDIFSTPVMGYFRDSSTNSERPEQINPLDMISGHTATTILGEGGIGSEHQVEESEKKIHPSHMAFLDPLHTPESSRTGITLQLPIGVNKKGKDLFIKAYNTKTNKLEEVKSKDIVNSTVGLPDQFNWESGKPKPKSDKIKVSTKGGDFEIKNYKDVDYVIPSPKGMFSVSSNLVPFLHSLQGNRAMMAVRQAEQAISLKETEEPLVQVKAGPGKTFEEVVGNYTSHVSPLDGTVTKITNDAIFIKDKKGKLSEVQIYDNYPLNNDQAVLDSKPIVNVGDSIKKGQVVADSNFTKNGKLALGKNLDVAYMPWKGRNYDDGIVISEDAAKKLTSTHMYKFNNQGGKNVIFDRKMYQANYERAWDDDQIKKLDESGVIKEGSTVRPGDVLVASMAKVDIQDNSDAKVAKLFKRKHNFKDTALKWDKDVPGKVVKVERSRNGSVQVHVRSNEPATIGDKIVGRHANKGIIVDILKNEDMPKNKDGKRVDVLLNPLGVTSRINPSQILETAASKIAEKTGKPYIVDNFSGVEDQREQLEKELKKLKIEDREELFDAKSNRSLGKVLTGKQYILKQKHQVSKKMSARAGGAGYAYDRNLRPAKGGKHSAQSMDPLGFYALLAHGANANVKEMLTWKSNMNQDFWNDLEQGKPLPPPESPFVYEKLKGLMQGMGVDVEKNGNKLQLAPLTDKGLDRLVENTDGGELKKAEGVIKSKTLDPEKSGLFDSKATGGFDGEKWSYFKLPKEFPNPVFEPAIASLVGLNKEEDVADVVKGKIELNGKTGPDAIKAELQKINVDKEIKDLEEQIPKLRKSELSKATKKLKYLRALKVTNLSPTEAYMRKKVAVLPPVMRPLAITPKGDVVSDGLNYLYKDLSLSVKALKELPNNSPEEVVREQESELYDGIKSLTLVGADAQGRSLHRKGIQQVLTGVVKGEGGQAKEGYFQSKIMSRAQDLAGRSTIIPEPGLGLDEVGVPVKMAKELYKPFVIRELKSYGYSPLMAEKLVSSDNEISEKVLKKVMDNRPIIMKRDPALHKYSVMGFKPKLTGGDAIKIHPLVTDGFNADFDGDAQSLYVPISNEAVEEVKDMMPSKNVFSATTGSPMHTPKQDSLIGLYSLTKMGKKTNKSFANLDLAKQAVLRGSLKPTDVVKIKGIETTVGRIMAFEHIPEGDVKNKIRRELMRGDFSFDKKGMKELTSALGKFHPGQYARAINKLKDLGNDYITEAGLTIGLKDLKALKTQRNSAFNKAEKRINERTKGIKDKDKIDSIKVEEYGKATKEIEKSMKEVYEKNPTWLWDMVNSGARGKSSQLRQMVAAPGLVQDQSGAIVPDPIKRSYGEGLYLSDYWTSLHGARKGTIQRARGTAEPGAMAKDLMNLSMHTLVNEGDCGTTSGTRINTDSKSVLNRYMSESVKVKDREFKPGTLVTPKVADILKRNKVSSIKVRSPIGCTHNTTEVCQKCVGITENGTEPKVGMNAGIVASQAMSEPLTQLAMNAFHEGGVAGTRGARSKDSFSRVAELLTLPKKISGSAAIATVDGKITSIKPDPAGGYRITIGKKEHYTSSNKLNPGIRVGATVKKGSALTPGPINPHDLLPTVGLQKTRNYITDELLNTYKSSGVDLDKRHAELVVRNLTNVAEVEDSKDHPLWVRGDTVAATQIVEYNKKVDPSKRIVANPILKGVTKVPNAINKDWLARLQHKDLNKTISDMANEAWDSNIHSTHPVPGMAFGTEFRSPGKDGKIYY